MARIGIDARLTFYRQGGIAQYTQHLIQEFAGLSGSEQYLILHSRKDERNLAIGANQKRISCWTPAHHRYERFALNLELLLRQLDLLHSPDFIPPIDGRFKSVITIHDLAFLFYPQFMTAESRRYYNQQIHAAVRRADQIIAVSQATRRDIIEQLGVMPNKITVVYEAANKQFSPPSVEEIARIRREYNLPQDYILFLGTYEPRKNIDGLLHAFDMLHKQMSDVPALVVAGKRGWLYEDIFALSEKLALGSHVIWAENIPFTSFPALYGGASLFCLPSHYEGFGLPPLEAMACGTPVIVSNRGSLPEIVGDAGLLVDPNQPEHIAQVMQSVLTDPALVHDLRRRGLARAAQFSWRRAAEETLNIYRRTLGEA